MEINLNTSAASAVGADRLRPRAPTPPPTDGETSFGDSAALTEALQSTPAVRTEAVERARNLVADPIYPPPELINGVARLLASKIQEISG
jgi:hypothetical protein